MDSLWATAVVPSMPGVRAALLSTVMIAALVLAAAPTPAIEEPLFNEFQPLPFRGDSGVFCGFLGSLAIACISARNPRKP
jgi:hypothetical protein